jgi:hypothetical protein
MKLVFLYGPPAVGKLTVAKELSKLTGFRIFHNHLTVDLLDAVFGWGTPLFSKYLTKVRLELLEAIAKDGTADFIFTYVYSDIVYDHFFIEDVKNVIEKHGGSVLFVQLICDEKVLLNRVKHASRKQHGKIKTKRMLKAVLRKHDLYARYSDHQTLTIDNTQISPRKAAILIRKHWRL